MIILNPEDTINNVRKFIKEINLDCTHFVI